MSLSIRPLRREEVAARLDDIAALRIAVFADWPYLYDGDMAYERAYLRPYAESDDAIVVGAFDDARLVGAATGTPLEDHAEEFGAAADALGVAGPQVFYCAESVLLPEYRGLGAGRAFFDAREAHARLLGRTHAAFCAVLRPDDHPRRPAAARDLHPFWRRRGYCEVPGAVAHFAWRDLDAPAETEKPLQFWLKRLE